MTSPLPSQHRWKHENQGPDLIETFVACIVRPSNILQLRPFPPVMPVEPRFFRDIRKPRKEPTAQHVKWYLPPLGLEDSPTYNSMCLHEVFFFFPNQDGSLISPICADVFRLSILVYRKH